MEFCGFSKQPKSRKLEIPELLEEKLVTKQFWIELVSKGSLTGYRRVRKLLVVLDLNKNIVVK